MTRAPDRAPERLTDAQREVASRVLAPPLDQARDWVASFIGASDEALDAITIMLALTWVRCFNAMPHLLAYSTEPASGKSSVLHAAIAAAGGRRWPVSATAATIDAIRASFRKSAGLSTYTTMILDETDKAWGLTGERGREELRGLITDAHKKISAWISAQVKGDTDDVATFGPIWMAGLGRAVPRDVRSRCVRIEMSPLGPEDAEKLRKSDDDNVQVEGNRVGAQLGHWAREQQPALRAFMVSTRPTRLHPKLYSRLADVWMPLFAIAHAAGGDWPARCLAAFTRLALDETQSQPPTLMQLMALDAGDFIEAHGTDRVLTSDLTHWLKQHRPGHWEDISTDDMERRLMREALGPAVQIRAVSVVTGEARKAQGRHARDIMPVVRELREMLFPAPAAEEMDAHEREVTGEALAPEEEAALLAEIKSNT